MIHRYMARADHLLSPTSSCVCLRVSMTSPLGCWPIVCSWIPARLTCSGARLLVVVISCPLNLSGSGLTSSSRRPQSEISESTLTPTSACDATFRKQLPNASPFYANCVVSNDQFQRQYTTRSSSLSSCHGSTMAMLCWWAYQPTCTTVCSLCSTLLRDPSPVYDAATISPTHLPVSTGWRFRSVLSSSWRQSSIVHWTVRLLTTWLQICAVCLTCRPNDVWDHHSLFSSLSASRSA